jgi:3-hydroxyisobutyrate dehydrogenase-like beta-hydroxyacid dehydrogenase
VLAAQTGHRPAEIVHSVVDIPREHRPEIAVLGAGSTAAAIVRRLVRVGFEVRARADSLVPYGAGVARTPAAAAARASTVITLMRDADWINEAMIGPDGAVMEMRPGTLWLQLTRVDELHAEAFAALAGTYRLAYVDAQMAGDWEAAERGRLIVLATGSESARAESQPILDAIGRQTRWGHPDSPPNGGFLRAYA